MSHCAITTTSPSVRKTPCLVSFAHDGYGQPACVGAGSDSRVARWQGLPLPLASTCSVRPRSGWPPAYRASCALCSALRIGRCDLARLRALRPPFVISFPIVVSEGSLWVMHTMNSGIYRIWYIIQPQIPCRLTRAYPFARYSLGGVSLPSELRLIARYVPPPRQAHSLEMPERSPATTLSRRLHENSKLRVLTSMPM